LSTARLYNNHYEYVYKDPDSVPGTATVLIQLYFFHIEAHSNGMACPPYDPQKELE